MTDELDRPAGLEPGPDLAEAERRAGDGGHGSLLHLVDELTGLLERSELAELEVEVGGTGLTLRKPAAVAAPAVAPTAPAETPAITPAAPGPAAAPAAPAERPAVRAPLTGIWYGAPSPGASAYVAVGTEIVVGQVVGLIEAMKLFNEIKSDLAGRVVRVLPDSGQLVKAKQPLIEVDPL